MPHRRLLYAAHRCGKTSQLARAAQEIIAAGVAPGKILALVPHAPAAAQLRESLRAATGLDIPTATLRRRAIAVLEAHPAAAHLPPGWQPSDILSGIDRRLLMRAAWQEAGSAHGSLWRERGDQPGALDWLARLWDRWSAWSGTANPDRLMALQPADSQLAELWQAYLGYLRICRELQVVAFSEIYSRASDALGLMAQPESSPRALLLDDLDLCDPGELLFIAALMRADADAWGAATAAPDMTGPLASERFLARWLDRHAFRIDAQATYIADPPRLSLGEYASPDDEAEALAARIAALPDPAAAAIIAFDPELPSLLRRALARLGVAAEGQAARDGYALVLAPLAAVGLKLLAGQTLTAAESLALATHPAFGLAHADLHIIAEAIRNRQADPFAPDDSRRPAGLSDDGWARLMAVRDVTHAARESAASPSARLERWLESLDLVDRAWVQTDAALPDWAAAIDRRHWERLMAFLRQSEALRRRLGVPLTAIEAVEVWESAQALIEPEGRSAECAVRIWQPDQLGGCAAHYVFVAGLHEGALPQPIPPLPLGDDDALSAAFGALPGFVAPQVEDRAAAWTRGTRDLARAIARGRAAAHLSYSRADRDDRRRLPSPILAAYLGIETDRHGSLLSGAAAQGVATDSGGAESRGISRQLAAGAHGPRLAGTPLAAMNAIADESPYVVSPSAIEDWFACPRRCFYARRLNLYDIASSPRQALGMVVHHAVHHLALEASVAPVSDGRALELLNEAWIADTRRWGSRLKAQVFRQLAERAVLHVARYERERSDGARFAGGELAFRWPLDGTDVVVAGRVDRIDVGADGLHVIDYKLGNYNPSINALLGEFRPPVEAAEAWRPGDIQLPVYALALERGAIDTPVAEPGTRVRSVSLLFPLELYDDNGRLRPTARRVIEIIEHADNCAACEASPSKQARLGFLCRRQLTAIEARVRAAVAGMRAGQWQPDPRDGARTCASCPFRPICPEPR